MRTRFRASALRIDPPAAASARRWILLPWLAVVFVALVLNVVAPLPGQQDARPWAAGLLAFPVAAGLVLAHRPRSVVGLLLGTVGTAAGIIFIGGWLSETYPGGWSRYLEALETVVVVAQFWAIISLLYVFPTGLPRLSWVRRGYGLVTAWMALMAVIGVMRPGPLDITGRDNPLGIGPESFTAWFDAGLVVLPVGVVGGVATLVHRHRHADAVERAQLKWFTSASTLVVATVGIIAFVPEGTVDALTFALVVAGFWALPSAIVVAVLRYRLFEVDRLVSRTATYAAVLVVLAGVYATGVFLVARVVPGQGDLAVAASTLAVAAMFRPLTRRMHHALGRRFNRRRYDSDLEISRFAERLRGAVEVEVDDLVGDLLGVVQATLAPATASLWVSSTHERQPAVPPGR
jgi:hypothetical protein